MATKKELEDELQKLREQLASTQKSDLVQLAVRVPRPLRKRVADYAHKHEHTMQHVTTQALIAYLEAAQEDEQADAQED